MLVRRSPFFPVLLELSIVLLSSVLSQSQTLGGDSQRVLGGEADFQFVNAAHGTRQWSRLDGKPLNTSTDIDELGWPRVDVSACIFDDRPTMAWKPPIDDPQKRQANYSGIWMLSLTGYADVSISSDSGCKGVALLNTSYDSFSNQLTGYIEFEKGQYPNVANLLVLDFANTRRNASAVNGTGFTGLRVIRPGYLDRPQQLFTDEWAQLAAPFNHLRFMGAMGMNSYSWQCAPPAAYACSVIEWKDRMLPDYAFFDSNRVLCKGCVGAWPWEYVVLAANELKKDIWINIPVTASGPNVIGNYTPSDPKQTYVYQLALLLRDGNEYTGHVGLDPSLNVYIEHSNEVWNFGFPQYSLNQAAAVQEANDTRGKTNLCSDAVPWVNCTYSPDLKNQQCWGHRRHARRVYEIGKVFGEVFGEDQINKRIRMVYASWTIQPQEYYNNTLDWLAATYGPIDKYIYAIASTQYFAPDKSYVANYGNMDPGDIADLYYQAATNNTNVTKQFVQLKQAFKVYYASYEAGTGNDIGGQFDKAGPQLSNFILANRHPNIQKALVHDIEDVFWSNGGDIYHQFSIHGKCSRFGCWGATEFYGDPPSPKEKAILQVTNSDEGTLRAFLRTRVPAQDPTWH